MQEIDLLVACFNPTIAPIVKTNMEYMKNKYFGQPNFEKLLELVDDKYELIVDNGFTDTVFGSELIRLGYDQGMTNLLMQSFQNMQKYTEAELHSMKTALSNVITNEAINKCKRENITSPVDFVKALRDFNVDNIQDVDKRIYRESLFTKIDIQGLKTEIMGNALKSSLQLLNDCSPLGGYVDRTLTMVSGKPGCFTGETEVMLADGSYRTMKDLYESQETNIPIFSYESNTGKIRVDIAERCCLTKEVSVGIRITLDSGRSFTCTPDHLWLTVNHGFVEAQELTIGEALMPIHRSLENTGTQNKSRGRFLDQPKYESVYTTVNRHSHNQFTHQLIGKCKMGLFYQEGMVYRHLDGDLLNNSYDNIIIASNSQHSTSVQKLRWSTDYERMARISIDNLPDNARRDITLEKIKELGQYSPSPSMILKKVLNCSGQCLRDRILESYTSLEDFWKDIHAKVRCSNNKILIPKDDLIDMALKANSVSAQTLASVYVNQYRLVDFTHSIETWFSSSKEFAKYIGITYRGGHGNKVKVTDIIKNIALDFPQTCSKAAVYRQLKAYDLNITKVKSLCKTITKDSLKYDFFDKSSIDAIASHYNVPRVVIIGILQGYDLRICDLQNNYKNHTVVKIEKIEFDTPVPVYDLVNAGEFHNFAIRADDGEIHSDSGIFVHNSGKSLFMIQEACMFCKQGKKVLYLALGDMNEFHFVTRIIAQQLNVSLSRAAVNFDTIYPAMINNPDFSWLNNLLIQYFTPDQISCENWISFIKSRGYYDEYDVFIVDYDTNFASDQEMYQKGETTYNQLKALSDRPGKWVFVGCQPKPAYFSEEILPLESGNESSRKQQIVDNMITISYPPTPGGINHVGIINVPKYRGGMTGSTPYFMDKNGRFEPITTEMYNYLKITRDSVTLPNSGCNDVGKILDPSDVPEVTIKGGKVK